MKRGTPGHPKTSELAAALERVAAPPSRQAEAVGILEALWHYAAAYAKRGDVGRFSDDAISRAVAWQGDAKTLVDVLVGLGWLDRCSCHRLRIHDWPDHADQTVRRSQEVTASGFLECYGAACTPPAPSPSETSEPLAPGAAGAPLAADGDGASPPLPEPEPEPEPNKPPLTPPGGGAHFGGASSSSSPPGGAVVVGIRPGIDPHATGRARAGRLVDQAADRIASIARAAGRPLSRARLRIVRRRLRERDLEATIAAELAVELKAAAELEAAKAAEQQRHRDERAAGEAWLARQGGRPIVVDQAAAWIRARADSSGRWPSFTVLFAQLQEWAEQAEAPAAGLDFVDLARGVDVALRGGGGNA